MIAESVFKQLLKKFPRVHAALSYLFLARRGELSFSRVNTRDLELGSGVSIGSGSVIGSEDAEVRLGDSVLVGSGCDLRSDLYVGEGSNIAENCESRGELRIGKYCAVARDVLFQGTNHDYRYAAVQHGFYSSIGLGHPEVEQKPIVLGNDVWIGARAIILPGVEVGDGAIVGAGSVVTSDVDEYEVVAGVPAEHIGYRFEEETRRKLLKLEWWDWSQEKLVKNRKLFEKNLDEKPEILDELLQSK
ncbi:MAG: CatB-related O-acetyltransferase [Candidatus Nanohaloarchaea archaeon]